jgi:hypothetical protein
MAWHFKPHFKTKKGGLTDFPAKMASYMQKLHIHLLLNVEKPGRYSRHKKLLHLCAITVCAPS